MKWTARTFFYQVLGVFSAMVFCAYGALAQEADSTVSELSVLLISDIAAPTPEEVVAESLLGHPLPAGLDVGDPVAVRFLLPDRAAHGIEGSSDLEQLATQLRRYIVITYPENVDLQEVQKELSSNPYVESVMVNLPVQLSLTPDSFLSGEGSLEAAPGDREQDIMGVLDCTEVCSRTNPGTCNDLCRQQGGGQTTCLQWLGPDFDLDGVSNSADNCPCIANSNQANCDGDHWGDVCDVRNERWDLIGQDLANYCYVDDDQHFLYVTIEAYGKRIYRNSCGGATCVQNVLVTDWDCPGVSSSDAWNCCRSRLGAALCDSLLGFDRCGTPKCSF